MANDNLEDLKNCKRPAPSNSSDPSDIDELIQENAEKIRVGRDFQAVIPKLLVTQAQRRERLNKKALLVWSPTEKISDVKLNEYILLSKEKYGYNSEQALGMLFWHHHDMEKALCDLANFAPLPDEWSTEDKVTFESAFNSIGKNFLRIKQMLPDKPIASLVKYYYLWKNKRKKSSVIDRQARKLANVRSNENQNGSREGSSSADSEPDDKKDSGEGCSKQSCSVCGVFVTLLQQTPKGSMCGTCYTHFRRTGGGIRPTLGPPRPNNRHLNVARNKRLPPRGMYVNHDDLQAIASGPNGQGDAILAAMDDEIQSNKQVIGQIEKKIKLDINEYRSNEPTPSRVTSRWTNDEIMLAVQGMRKYGKNFQAIAETIGTKTQNHLKTFYSLYRKRYNLDTVLQEYDDEHNSVIELSDEEEVVDTQDDPTASSSRPNTPSAMVSGSRPLNNLTLSNPKAHQTAAAAK
ncbi:REST corepressor-like isoform X2 [Adelges cooleyi]|uniref:REST corepressor-like isoform X2 n=1 Tax=Adelges cooleyi TaxID=133065 RepID=UPI0021807CB5|nr:REST corepressor-like isoform X2 [Adelges cooleyi]